MDKVYVDNRKALPICINLLAVIFKKIYKCNKRNATNIDLERFCSPMKFQPIPRGMS